MQQKRKINNKGLIRNIGKKERSILGPKFEQIQKKIVLKQKLYTKIEKF